MSDLTVEELDRLEAELKEVGPTGACVRGMHAGVAPPSSACQGDRAVHPLLRWLVQVLGRVGKQKERILLEHQEMRLCVVCQVRQQQQGLRRTRLIETGGGKAAADQGLGGGVVTWQEREKTVLLLPCRHLCLCQRCSSGGDMSTCPLCRRDIYERLDVFA